MGDNTTPIVGAFRKVPVEQLPNGKWRWTCGHCIGVSAEFDTKAACTRDAESHALTHPPQGA